MKNKPQQIIDRYRKMVDEKAPWLPLYQLLGEYIMTRKQSFVADTQHGEFLTSRLFDRSGSQANHLFQSSMIGALWPNGAKSVQIEPPTALQGTEFEDDETKKFYEQATQVLVEKVDHPRAGFGTALEEYMADQGAFGVSGIAAFENDSFDVPVQFSSVDIKRFVVGEGKDGFVDTIFVEKELTVRQMVLEYGLENLSQPLQEKWGNGNADEKVRVLHAIEPRMEFDPHKYGVQDMPIASIHIEIKTKKVLKESGFIEMPIFVTRFWKMMGEVYGRSPGMEALSDVTEINAIREASIIAIEKSLDPPLAVFDDGTLGGGVIDTSAGAINVFSVSGRMNMGNHRPVEPIVEGGELNSTYARITELREEIKNAFFIDRLLDFNSQQRMQNPEVMLRDRLRGQSLGTIYSRQIAELFIPLLERVFNILLRKGIFGVIRGSKEEAALLAAGQTPVYIPDKVAELMLKDKDVYKITFISPAARIMQAEALIGIEHTLTTAANVAGVLPEVLDNIDIDKTIRRVRELTGAPSEMMKSLDAVKKVREARQQQQEAMVKAAAEKEQSETARNVAQSAKAVDGIEGLAA